MGIPRAPARLPRWKSGFAAALSAALLLVSPAGAEGATPTCADANALRQAHLLGPAVELYREIEAADRECLFQASALREQQAAQAAFKRGQTAEKAGNTRAAREGYEQALAIDASLEEARTNLLALTGGEQQAWHEEARAWADDVVDALENLAVPAILAAAAVMTLFVVLWFVLRLPLLKLWLRRHAWEPHAYSLLGASTWKRRRIAWRRFYRELQRRATSTPLEVKDFKAPEGVDSAAVRAALRSELPRLGPRSGGRVTVVATPAAAGGALETMAKSVSELPPGKILEALVTLFNKLRPRDALTLNGQVLPAGERGLGLALALEASNGALVDSVTLWAADFGLSVPVVGAEPDTASHEDEPEDLEVDGATRLAVAGACWTAFTLLRFQKVLKQDEWHRVLGTNDWRTFALLQVCVRVARGHPARLPEQLLSRARDLDPESRTAMFDLAVAHIAGGRYALADSLLEQVGEGEGPLTDVKDKPALTGDPIRFQVAYTRAVLALHEQPVRGSEVDRERDDAAQELNAKLRELETALIELESDKRRDREAESLYALLRRIEGPGLATLAQLLGPQRLRDGGKIGAGRRALMEELKREPPRPLALIDWARRQSWRTADTHYNLGCFYASTLDLNGAPKDAGRLAESHLTAAFARGGVVLWAQRDPVLRSFRARDGGRGWWRLIAPFLDADAKLELTQLELIGRQAARLAEVGVRTSGDLVNRARDPIRRRELGEKTSVSPERLEQWARAAALKQRLEASWDETNLLVAAGVGSVDALRQLNVKTLGTALENAQAPKADAAETPSDDTLKDWIEKAHSRPDEIQPVTEDDVVPPE